jgi:hypothetical protein
MNQIREYRYREFPIVRPESRASDVCLLAPVLLMAAVSTGLASVLLNESVDQLEDFGLLAAR